MVAPRALVVVNGAARGGATALAAEVEAHLGTQGWGSELVAPSDRDATAAELATRSGSGPWAVVVAVGGDGTVGAVAEALAEWTTTRGEADGAAPPLLIIPGGTGNSLYRALWADRPWSEVTSEVVAGSSRVRQLDLLAVTPAHRAADPDRLSTAGPPGRGVRALLGVSAGLVAEAVAASATMEGPGGRDRYVAAALAALEHHVPFPARVRVDGEVVAEGPTSLVAVGGARHRSGSFQLLPRSVLDDGLADVCVIAGVDAAAFMDLAADVMTGDHLGQPGVSYARGRSLSVERTDGGPLVCEVDGDLWPEGADGLRVDVLPGAVAVCAPRRAVAG